jgi:hypothetical protein
MKMATKTAAAHLDRTRATHSLDFTSVNWFGTRYTFAAGQQSRAVALLWSEFDKGEFTLSEKTIGEHIGSSADDYELRKTFQLGGKGRPMHPAWGVMIVRAGRNLYRLARPATAKKGRAA